MRLIRALAALAIMMPSASVDAMLVSHLLRMLSSFLCIQETSGQLSCGRGSCSEVRRIDAGTGVHSGTSGAIVPDGERAPVPVLH